MSNSYSRERGGNKGEAALDVFTSESWCPKPDIEPVTALIESSPDFGDNKGSIMPQQLTILDPPSELDRLRDNLGIELPAIQGARKDATAFRQRLESSVLGLTSEDSKHRSIRLAGERRIHRRKRC